MQCEVSITELETNIYMQAISIIVMACKTIFLDFEIRLSSAG